MPQRRSGIKALRKNQKNRLRNLNRKTTLKKTIKKFKDLVAAKNFQEAQASLNLVYKKLDKAVKINIISKNTSSRRKSRLAKLLQTTKQQA